VLAARPVGSQRYHDAQREAPSAATSRDWLNDCWREAAASAAAWRASGDPMGAELPFVLVVDEVQHVAQWPGVVKGLWDAERDTAGMHLVLLGSAPLLVQHGLSEGLTGRYELVRLPHWSFVEMSACFDTSMDEFLYFGGYPGSAEFFSDERRWRDYIRFSLIEPSIERDVLAMARVEAPAMLRRLFELGSAHSAQILALTKVSQTLGEGHVLTLAHHLTLLANAGLLTGLHKFASNAVRRRQSPPKFQALNNALMNALGSHQFDEARDDRTHWGQVVESAVGAHLLATADPETKIHYWRNGGFEVDFIVEQGNRLAALEVKSGATHRISGLTEFCSRNPTSRRWVVGGDDLPLEEFFKWPAAHWAEG
jgi:uncharacterized protein